MGGNSGIGIPNDNNELDQAMEQNSELMGAQNFMRKQSLDLLNQELVRSQRQIGFGSQPEPGPLDGASNPFGTNQNNPGNPTNPFDKANQ